MRSSTLPLLTLADLEATPDDGNRYEIIDGELFVSSAPSVMHQRVLMRIAAAFIRYLDRNPVGELFPGVGVNFDDNNGVIPDLVFVSRERAEAIVRDGRLSAAPDIALEILSPGSSNARRDRRVKLDLYSAQRVGEYWIVDPENREVEIYRQTKAGLERAAHLRSQDLVESRALPGFSVAISDLFGE